MVDVDRIMKKTVTTGKVEIGSKQTKNAISKKTAKLVVMANNCPNAEELSKLSEDNTIPLYAYPSNSVDLGYACGKNFSVSVFSVLEEGSSGIMNLVTKKGSNNV